MIETIYLAPIQQSRIVVLDVILKKGKTFDEINKKLKEKGFYFEKEMNNGVRSFFRFSKKENFPFNHLDNAEVIIKSDIGNFLGCSVHVELVE